MPASIVEHSLIIDSYRDLIAHCLCDRWVIRAPTFDCETQAEIWARADRAYQEHINY